MRSLMFWNLVNDTPPTAGEPRRRRMKGEGRLVVLDWDGRAGEDRECVRRR